VQRIGRDDPTGEVQPVQQWPEPDDLIGGGLDVGLGEDRTGGVDQPTRGHARHNESLIDLSHRG
jgi:hypothetical protein